MKTLLWAALGTGFTFLMTSCGAALVYIFKGKTSENIQRIFLGFAAGIMIAASIWSLLIPAITQAEEMGMIPWIPAAGGFTLGGICLLALDNLLPHLHIGSHQAEGMSSRWKRTTLLISSVTLHNIPEGMAVGLMFAMAAQQSSAPSFSTAAFALALGIGIQNFPEGAAISLPLHQEGMSVHKSFLCGSLSGIVEPIFGILCVLAAGNIQPFMPWLLSFAAGAMIYVVVEELIPEAHLSEHSHIGTAGIMVGFLIMMILDIALG